MERRGITIATRGDAEQLDMLSAAYPFKEASL
jgi:hypothetical protein